MAARRFRCAAPSGAPAGRMFSPIDRSWLPRNAVRIGKTVSLSLSPIYGIVLPAYPAQHRRLVAPSEQATRKVHGPY